MSVAEAIKAIQGRLGYVATRPRGIVIRVNDNGKVEKFGRKGPHSWQPGLMDLIADDWMILSPETQLKLQQQRAAELAAQQESNDGGDTSS